MRILVIAQHLFPIKTPRAHRTTELVKELSRQGHSVVVYAVIGTYDYKDFEKTYNVQVKPIPVKLQFNPYTSDGSGERNILDQIFGRLLGKLLEFPNIEFLFSIPKIIKKESKFDALISIADPHQIHWGCSKALLKYPLKFPEKWICDSGDPFMNNDKTKKHYKYYAKFEHLYCNLCDYLTVPVENAINGYYPECRNKIKIIPQGFNFELPIQKNEPSNKVITFAFAGIFYKDIRNPEAFLDYLGTLHQDFRFVVYTPYKQLLQKYIPILNDKLIIYEPINREELIVKLKEMDFLINIENVDRPYQTPSKLIDYALTGRPILSINPVAVDTVMVDEFFQKNYSQQFIVTDIEQYHISNVVKKFISLIE